MKSRDWEVIHSSNRNDWQTPSGLFQELDAEFGFKLDAAASDANALCESYFTKEENALSVRWFEQTSGPVWLNPPYGRGVGKWVEKAYRESLHGLIVVVLVFASTDTKWFHEYAMRAAEIRFIKGRVRFNHADGIKAGPAPKGSCLLIFDPESNGAAKFSSIKSGAGW